MTPPLPQRYALGMPQLGHCGLSEHWLMKECGHCHWQGIADAQGRSQPEFRDAAGRKAYAAFTLVRTSAARLDQTAEHDGIAIASAVVALGRSQHYGLHTVTASDGGLATVEMLSAFVRRERAGDNRSVVRAAVDESAAPLHGAPLQVAAKAFGERARAWRSGVAAREAAGSGRFGAAPAEPLQRFTFLPCPNTDFNGAAFLYFASFQALVDRAEWAWFGISDQRTVAARELAFYGNVNIGEAVEVRLRALHDDGDTLAHWCAIHRASDGHRLADVCTTKRRIARESLPS